MNVQQLHLHVNTPVLTLWVVFSVPVTVGICWMMMEDHVMVH